MGSHSSIRPTGSQGSMSDEHTENVTVKRKTKKKSGYVVREEDREYYISEVPPKARVNIDDKIVSINGVKKNQFADEHEANELIESVHLVIVPQAEIEEYDRKKALEDAASGGGSGSGGGALVKGGGNNGGANVSFCDLSIARKKTPVRREWDVSHKREVFSVRGGRCLCVR